MNDSVRQMRLLREMESLFLPEYDAVNMPSPEKRSAYALEHIAYRLGKLDEKFDTIGQLEE